MDGDEVAEALRHLLTLHLEEAVMQPVIRHHRRVEGTTRLRDLVLMVREDEVDAAAMDVEGLAEMLPRHGRAFDMPAGTPRCRDAGRRRPRRLAWLRRLPQNEVHRVALVGRDLDAGAGDHLVKRPA